MDKNDKDAVNFIRTVKMSGSGRTRRWKSEKLVEFSLKVQ